MWNQHLTSHWKSVMLVDELVTEFRFPHVVMGFIFSDEINNRIEFTTIINSMFVLNFSPIINHRRRKIPISDSIQQSKTVGRPFISV